MSKLSDEGVIKAIRQLEGCWDITLSQQNIDLYLSSIADIALCMIKTPEQVTIPQQTMPDNPVTLKSHTVASGAVPKDFESAFCHAKSYNSKINEKNKQMVFEIFEKDSFLCNALVNKHHLQQNVAMLVAKLTTLEKRNSQGGQKPALPRQYSPVKGDKQATQPTVEIHRAIEQFRHHPNVSRLVKQNTCIVDAYCTYIYMQTGKIPTQLPEGIIKILEFAGDEQLDVNVYALLNGWFPHLMEQPEQLPLLSIPRKWLFDGWVSSQRPLFRRSILWRSFAPELCRIQYK